MMVGRIAVFANRLMKRQFRWSLFASFVSNTKGATTPRVRKFRDSYPQVKHGSIIRESTENLQSNLSNFMEPSPNTSKNIQEAADNKIDSNGNSHPKSDTNGIIHILPTPSIAKPHLPIDELLDEDLSFKIPPEKLHRFSIAPMIDVSIVHFRFFIRLLTRYSTLWTEMLHSGSLKHNPEFRARELRFNNIEHPVVIQLGGSDDAELAEAAKHCEEAGFDEVNLNCGCPSERVQSGCFGAVLMLEPQKVARCIKRMRDTVKIPVHVKCRIGVDDQDSYDFIKNFVDVVSREGGCEHFIIHSRKCLLQGLNPHQNRTIPPLKYDVVKQLKKDFPKLHFTINGGLKTYEQFEEFLDPSHGLIGVMVGRLAMDNPWVLSDIDRRIFGLPNPGYSRREILQIWGEYGDKEIQRNEKLSYPTLVKPIINLFHGERNSGIFRRMLSDKETHNKCKKFSDLMKLVVEELEQHNKESLDARAPSEPYVPQPKPLEPVQLTEPANSQQNNLTPNQPN